MLLSQAIALNLNYECIGRSYYFPTTGSVLDIGFGKEVFSKFVNIIKIIFKIIVVITIIIAIKTIAKIIINQVWTGIFSSVRPYGWKDGKVQMSL